MVNVFIKSYGCSTNFSEGEVMAGILERGQFKIVDSPEEAYVVIVNICTVKGDTAAIKHVRDLHTQFPDKKFIVSGCITQEVMVEVRKFEPSASFVSTHNIKCIVEIVEETLNDNAVELIAYSQDIKANLPKHRKNKLIAMIPILSGCNGSCAYCSVKSIKGELYSYPMADICDEARKAVMSGAKELWITSQDNACYMLDSKLDIDDAMDADKQKNMKSRLPELLKNIIAIPGDFKIRLGMMNPNNVLPILRELIEIYRSDKIFKFLHVPLQSGDDGVLKKMGRKYTSKDFKHIIDSFRKEIPGLTIAADAIVGFPGESRAQFSTTLEFLRWITPDVLNISKFRSRPGTAADEMDDKVDNEEIKNRSALLTSVFHNMAYICNERWYKWRGTVLVDGRGKDNTWIAHNFAYKPVILEGDFELGQTVEITITKVTVFYLKGEKIPIRRNSIGENFKRS